MAGPDGPVTPRHRRVRAVDIPNEANRRNSHLSICLDAPVEFPASGFDSLRFDHEALFDVRAHAPELRLLVGNLDAVQLNYGVAAVDINALIQSVGCDAFNLHLNPVQEAVQFGGNTNFSGCWRNSTGPLRRRPYLCWAKESAPDIRDHGAETGRPADAPAEA